MASPSRRWLLHESARGHAPGYGVFLPDLIAALGAPTLGELTEACPHPALLELPPQVLAGDDPVFFDAEPDFLAAEVDRRLSAVLTHPGARDAKAFFLTPERPGAPVVVGDSLRTADVKLTDPEVEPRHAAFSVRRGLRRVTDLESRRGTRLETGRLRAGIPLPVVGGQRVAFGRYRTLFLEPATLLRLLTLHRAQAIAARFGPEGLRVRDALDLFDGLRRDELDGLPPFLLQVPTEGGDTGALAHPSKTTRRLPPEVIVGLRRSKRVGQARLHLLTADGEEVLLGRGAACAVVLPEASVSKRHAAVRRLPRGVWSIVDLASNNGTFLDGRRLPEGLVAPLSPGAQVWLAGYRGLFLTAPQAFDLLGRLRARKTG